MIKEILSLKLYSSKNSLLSKEEKNIFKANLRKICHSAILPIYRGDANLVEQYRTDTNNIPLLSEHIFLIGSKGYSFWNECKKNYICTDASCEGITELLWKRFHNKVCYPDKFCNPNSRIHIQEFLNRNPNFYEFFHSKSNKKVFVTAIKSICDERTRIAIKDYYFAILQTIGKSGYGENYFNSTSTSLKVAETFIENRENGIVLFGWVPKDDNSYITYERLSKSKKVAKKFKLPIIQYEVYPEQKEVCLKAGMLPHFIIGYKFGENFIVNPAMLNDINEKMVSQVGFHIDQSEFERKIRLTNYNKYYIVTNGNYDLRNLY